MIQEFETEMQIALLTDPITLFFRNLVKPCIYIDTINKSITITWHMEHITPTDVKYLTTTHKQVADNTILVVIANGERISIEQYEAQQEKPVCMGEYDYWHYANRNSPFPVMEQVELYGTIFAQRNGWL